MEKRSLSERDICTKFITPALRSAGWDEITQIREEISFTKGRIIVRGKLVSRGKAKRADYILSVKPNIPIALIEAKENTQAVGAGLQQGLNYAETLGIPFVFSSNGDGFVFHDRTGMSAAPEITLTLDQFPSPDDLWARYRKWKGLSDAASAVALQDYFDDGSGKAPRYYQINAVNAAIEAIANPPFGGKEEDGIEGNFPTFRTRETADLFLALIIRQLKPGGRAAVVLPDGSVFGEGIKTRLKEHLMEECNLHTIVRLPNSVFKPYASNGTNLLFFEKGTPTQDIWYWEHRVPETQKAYSMTKPIRLDHLNDCAAWWGGSARQGRVEGPQAWRVTAAEVKARGYNLDIKNPHTVAADHGDPETLLADLTAAEAQVDILRDQLKAILSEALAR